MEYGLQRQQDLIIGLPEDWGKQTLVLEGTNKMHAFQDWEERSSDPTEDWTETTC